jgi:DivIVA domain-containing protein
MNYNRLRVKQIQMRKTHMKITAADISQKQFMVMPEGLDAEEVYAFLEVIKEDFYELEKETAVLMEKVASQGDRGKALDAAILAMILLLEKAAPGISEIQYQAIIDHLVKILSPLRKSNHQS